MKAKTVKAKLAKEVEVPYDYLADGAQLPIQPNESLDSIARRSVVQDNGPLIVDNPNFEALVADYKRQVTQNIIDSGG